MLTLAAVSLGLHFYNQLGSHTHFVYQRALFWEILRGAVSTQSLAHDWCKIHSSCHHQYCLYHPEQCEICPTRGVVCVSPKADIVSGRCIPALLRGACGGVCKAQGEIGASSFEDLRVQNGF